MSLSMARQWKNGTWILIGTFMYCRNPSNLLSGFSHSYLKYCLYNQQSREGFFFLNVWLFTQGTVDSFVTTGIRRVCYSRSKSFYFGFQGPFGAKSCITDFTVSQLLLMVSG